MISNKLLSLKRPSSKFKTMNKTLIIIIILCLGYCRIHAQNLNSNKLDSLISHIESNNQAIGSVAVTYNGTTYQKDFGGNKIPGQQKISKVQSYQIGSVTKMLTATMIYQLIEKGKLKLSDKVAAFYPEIPNAQNINIGNLLSHSSGLGDYLTKNDTLKKWLIQPVKESEIFKEIKRQGTLFQPGDSVRYSNSGYFLLAKILEIKYNKTYAAILEKQISRPLGLKNTYATQNKSKNSIAQPYAFSEQWKKVDDLYFPNVIGVGDVSSTPEDLNKILHALFSHQLISETSLNQMKPKAGKKFGAGMMQIPFDGVNLYGHGGDTFGTHSIAIYNPIDNVSISICLNGQIFTTKSFALAILNIIYNKNTPLPDFTTYNVESDMLPQYEGTYAASDFPKKIRIFIQDKNLKAQAEGQSHFDLTPLSKDQFGKPNIGLKMEFSPSENKMILSQGGKKFTLMRESK